MKGTLGLGGLRGNSTFRSASVLESLWGIPISYQLYCLWGSDAFLPPPSKDSFQSPRPESKAHQDHLEKDVAKHVESGIYRKINPTLANLSTQ